MPVIEVTEQHWPFTSTLGGWQLEPQLLLPRTHT